MDYKEFYTDIINLVNFINNNKKEIELINKKKKEFFNKYNDYYNTVKMKNKIIFYKKSINHENKINVIKKERTNLNRLNKIIDIYYSDIDLYNKIDKITSVFKNHTDLWINYNDLIIPLFDTKFIKDLNKIFMFLKKNNQIVDFVRYYSDNTKKYSNYKYARFIIESYLNKNEEIDLESFLFNMGIDEKVFDYCVDTICEFDIDLFNKYKKKRIINDSNERYNNKKIIINLAKDLSNSFDKGNCSYSVSEFFKKVPFKYSKNFSSDLINFVRENDPYDFQIIHDYIYINKFYKNDINKQLDLKSILSSFIFIDEYEVTKDDIKKVLTYMQDNDYPMINVVFYDILRKYIKNDIVLNDIKYIKKRKMLIP